MTPAAFNAFCATLPGATHACQWGGSDVWKVGGKVFAIASWDDKLAGITFKVTPLSFEVLRAPPGRRPAPYLASRGLKWIQHHARPGLSRAELEQYLRVSHRLVAQGLSRKARTALGLA
ncbi:MAG: MmcQ/YjbR family DNA-binding protein [Alphaproteobacteria bacterium]